MFKNTQYVSEFTQFMQGYLVDNPEVAQGQLEGRALLWDKAPLDLDERVRAAESKVQQKPYPYQAD
ncbi:DUF3460 family protein [Iodobacter fluviatilis]|uniref:Protein of uncharacterized function (DUF3460) n=1 Tax=Iodobacter fluviatilis TaxID=537 RepID=A0A377Q7S6_9NEIS|nr:DUF3460 family protein [Iodobacter fluviatilis]TCU89552.1 uncharacterized protein DUF3460 [Iodobacter fluviatilis]STQ90922.1 Protein of uncharacterised function (DUF3460) [Iodobacter fluviatilis]